MERTELEKKALELEQTLGMQLSLVKKESEGFAKIGGAIILGGVVAFSAVKLLGRKKNKKTDKVLQTLEKEGLLDEEIKQKLTQRTQPGMFGRLGAILLPIAINYGKEQFFKKMNESENSPEKNVK
ncbi:hypothetical protein [Aquiflexum sp.]|uniref:hypothetical protein n=1 Tax=Aquiflexum sp. TaxID=1872584 RepID=UPI0035936FBD